MNLLSDLWGNRFNKKCFYCSDKHANCRVISICSIDRVIAKLYDNNVSINLGFFSSYRSY